MTAINVLKPVYSQEEIDAVAEVLRSGWSGLGPKTEEFERAFAGYIGARFCIGTNSCTSALELALRAVGIQSKADGVIVPPLTFVSTAHTVELCGGTVIFADIDPETLCMSPEGAAACARQGRYDIRAVIPVHYAGHPCDLPGIRHALRETWAEIIEDAAHACGAAVEGKRVGSLSALTCFSFHAVKNLSMGEGGAITTNEEDLDVLIRKLRWVGIDKSTFSRSATTQGYAWSYAVEHLGLKAHLSDIAAAIGLVQLRKLDVNNARRAEIARRYSEGLTTCGWLKQPIVQPGMTHAWHLYVIRVPAEVRDRLISHLKAQDIHPGIHYLPLYRQPYYRERNYRPEDYPVTEKVWPEILSLPMHLGLSNADVDRVIETVQGFQP